MGTIVVEGEVNIGDNYYLDFSNWNAGEPNNSPSPENAAEIVNSSGKWNDAHENTTQDSYVEYEGLITSLGDLVYLGQYSGHSYFRNPQDLNWQNAKEAAENLGGYLASIHTSEENSAIISFGFFRGWIGLYQDTSDSNYSEPSGGWKWVSPTVYNTTEYTSIKVELLRNGTLVETLEQNLNYSNDIASFSFNLDILAELAKYRIKVYSLVGDSSELIRDVDDIVAGDVYIVQGQSNAAAVMYNGSSGAYQNDYLRVYSGGYTNSSSVISDDQWYYAQGDGNENSGGNAGQWGLALSKMIKDQFDIPIAIFNGAHGGQPIEFFQRPEDYDSSTSTNYGRLYYRLNKSGLKSYVRAVLWSQGESNSFVNGLSTNQYKSYFENLMTAWQEDFPNIEKYYIFQTRECGCGTELSGRLQIKEAQRLLAVENDNLTIMPTAGMTLHWDNCHFPFVNGYEKFAQRIFNPLAYELYNIVLQEVLYAPMMTNIVLNENQQIVITTDAELLMTNTNDEASLLNKITNDFFLSDANNVSITGFSIDQNQIILNLNGDPGNQARISFLGQYDSIEDNITNGAGIELVSFGNYCISGECNSSGGGIPNDEEKTPALVFVENGDGNPHNGQTYVSSERGASRSGNGNSNDAFGNIGDWSVDLTVSEKSPQQAANDWGNFTESGHPVYTNGDGSQGMLHTGMGATGWGSFAANAYNRSSGLGSVALGFHTIAGKKDQDQTGISGDNVGQFAVGWSVRATGNRAFAAGHRTVADGGDSVAMGNWNYATGDATVALGKENWAEGASTIAIGFKNHAAGGGSVSLGQENVAWGTTNFTAGYQNVAGDTSSGVGSGGSATAMGKYNVASADASMALNRATTATNQAATSMGLGTTADNVGMLAVGVNNAAGLGDTNSDYYYVDGAQTGTTPGVAFVVGNGDIDSSNGRAGDNPSNAFIVYYDGDATLSGDLTVNSDARLKSNIMSLGSTLSKLLLIDGKKYTMKANDAVSKIGLLAQDVQQAFPELVKVAGDDDGTMSVNYQGMIPVLINAINEQQKQIEELKAMIEK